VLSGAFAVSFAKTDGYTLFTIATVAISTSGEQIQDPVAASGHIEEKYRNSDARIKYGTIIWYAIMIFGRLTRIVSPRHNCNTNNNNKNNGDGKT